MEDTLVNYILLWKVLWFVLVCSIAWYVSEKLKQRRSGVGIKQYESKVDEIFKTKIVQKHGELALNAFDPLHFKLEINGDCVYGYWRHQRITGDQDYFTVHLQLTSPWNLYLKDKVGKVVDVSCYYKNENLVYTFFEQKMKVSEHKLGFHGEVPTVSVKFKIN